MAGMTADEIGWIDWGFKGLVAAVAGLFWWMWGKLVSAVTKNGEKLVQLDMDIRNHTLEDSRLYVSKSDFRDTVTDMKDTTKRIYERIDLILDKLNKIS